jgi:uncharacterized protein with LGFP repeats
MSLFALRLGPALALTVLALAGRAAAQANPEPATESPVQAACGFKLSAAAFHEWTLLGGEEGRLGCPTADETDIPPSSHGKTSREIVFADRGAIFTYLAGPMAGNAVAISDCFRLFYQYGGASGWLGLPLGDALNTPDGQKQAYEGGEMRFGRALDSCEATRTGDEP